MHRAAASEPSRERATRFRLTEGPTGCHCRIGRGARRRQVTTSPSGATRASSVASARRSGAPLPRSWLDERLASTAHPRRQRAERHLVRRVAALSRVEPNPPRARAAVKHAGLAPSQVSRESASCIVMVKMISVPLVMSQRNDQPSRQRYKLVSTSMYAENPLDRWAGAQALEGSRVS